MYHNDDEMRARGRAVTPEEKRKVIERLYKAWLKNPHMRLGQLLWCHLDGESVRTDLFCVEDQKLADLVDPKVKKGENG